MDWSSSLGRAVSGNCPLQPVLALQKTKSREYRNPEGSHGARPSFTHDAESLRRRKAPHNRYERAKSTFPLGRRPDLFLYVVEGTHAAPGR